MRKSLVDAQREGGRKGIKQKGGREEGIVKACARVQRGNSRKSLNDDKNRRVVSCKTWQKMNRS